MTPFRCVLGSVILIACGHALQESAAPQPQPAESPDGVYLLIRSDDAGMSHAAAPSLVDEHGYLFHSAEELYQNEPDLGELERELRAQIERALATGLRIDYLDYHMGTAVRYLEFRTVVERLGSEYDLGLSGYYGDERFSPQYWAEPEAKLDSLLAMVGRLEPGYHVLVTHLGLDTPEPAALVDMNIAHPLESVSKHRQAELDAVIAKVFGELLVRYGVTPITYRQLLGTVRAAGPSSPRK